MAGKWVSVIWMMTVLKLPTLVTPGTGLQLPEITNEKFIDECVKSHNQNRSNVNPPAGNMRYMVRPTQKLLQQLPTHIVSTYRSTSGFWLEPHW